MNAIFLNLFNSFDTILNAYFVQINLLIENLLFYNLHLTMSSIKSQSLFSSTKNIQFPQDLKPNQSTSNIFKSIFDHLPPKPKSILIESLVQINHHFHPNRSLTLMDKIITAGYRQHPALSYSNWAICKHEGVSEEEDISDQVHFRIPLKQEDEVKEQPISQEPNPPNEWLFSLSDSPKKIKNQTKNIPKNYGKAIISFVEKYKCQIQRITNRFGVNYETFLNDLRIKKKSINTIADLRTLWSDYKYAKCMRIISGLFLRKYALSYIFSSRICTFNSHIKYRQRLYEAISSPEEFRHIKDY